MTTDLCFCKQFEGKRRFDFFNLIYDSGKTCDCRISGMSGHDTNTTQHQHSTCEIRCKVKRGPYNTAGLASPAAPPITLGIVSLSYSIN
jgi:hypothetical protein